MPTASDDVWAGLGRIVERADDVGVLAAHGLELIGGRRWRAIGRDVPPELAALERLSAMASLLVPVLVGRLRELHDGPLVVFKGPEVAARYPDPVLRRYRDLDVLVPNAPALQARLLAAGFEEVGDPRRYGDAAAHDRPLRHPDLPFLVEVHARPNWPDFIAPPRTAELLAAAVPALLGIEGVSTLAPTHHAMLLAVHAWQHGPLARVRDLAEVLVLAREVPAAELDATARAWGIDRLWRTVVAVAEATVLERGNPWALRTWARNLLGPRERTVVESHLARWVSPLWALPPARGLRAVGAALGNDLGPKGDESWGTKARRTRRSLANALSPKSAHDEKLDPEREGGARLNPRRSTRAPTAEEAHADE